MDRPRITIFDHHLRDGEQSPGWQHECAGKLRLAQQLDRLGVERDRSRIPIASDGDSKRAKVYGSLRPSHYRWLGSRLYGTLTPADLAALQGAAPFRASTSLASSDIHLRYKQRITR